MNTWRGTDDPDRWQGEEGDRLFGGGGDDTLYGTFVYGEEGNDRLFGFGSTNDLIFGGDGNDYLMGFGGRDTLGGGEGDDTLFGSSGASLIRGSYGNDRMHAGSNSDTLIGGAGNDTIYASSATPIDVKDYPAENTVYGRSGADTFNFTDIVLHMEDGLYGETADIGVIKDFNLREDDRIELLSSPNSSHRIGSSNGDTLIYATARGETHLIGVIEDTTAAEVKNSMSFVSHWA